MGSDKHNFGLELPRELPHISAFGKQTNHFKTQTEQKAI